MTKIYITQQTFTLTCSCIPICNHSSPDCCPDIVMSSQKTSFLRNIHQIMAKAKPFLQHFTSCTIWLGPKTTGGGFNDRADVQCTCRGMLGGWAKKNTHQVFGLERLHKVSCGVGAGWGCQTHVYNKRQVTGVKLCWWKTEKCNTVQLSLFSFSLMCHYPHEHSTTWPVLPTNIFSQIHKVDSLGILLKYSVMEIQSSWQICTAASVGCGDESTKMDS